MVMATLKLHPFSYFSASIDKKDTSLRSVSGLCITLDALRPPHERPQGCQLMSTPISGKMVTKATGEAPTQVVADAEVAESEPADETFKLFQDTWDKVENKYAVTSLAVAALLAVWVSAGVISAIDRLPLVPALLELTGIGYTAWFVYQNLINQPKREELLKKIRDTYNEITGIN